MTVQNDRPVPKIIDFGVAKATVYGSAALGISQRKAWNPEAV
jgi:hypothetical protein